MSPTTFAMVFPGQGSQSAGMLRDFLDEETIKEVFDVVSDAVGMDLWTLLCHGSEDELARTEVTQPLMLAADVALYRLWRRGGGREPSVVAGHSLGEYPALVVAEALTLTEAARLVAQRARLMQEAVPQGRGGMAAVLGLDDETVADVCRRVTTEGRVLEPVNFNAPAQVVVAGDADAVRAAVPLFREAGARKVVILPVSVPAHSRLMQAAGMYYREVLSTVAWKKPRIPVIHNVDASPHPDPSELPDLLARQLSSPVLWVQSVQTLRKTGATAFVECGPGRVLGGLVRRILPEATVQGLFDRESMEQALTDFGDPREVRS